MSHKVSIVIPTYSRNDTLKRAIASALIQTYKNIEILVVDDNPVESEWRQSTSKLMEEYADNPLVRYIQNPQNLGGSGARNTGIKAAKGEYIAFLDDDDEFLPENVEKKLEVFSKSYNDKLALVYGFSEYVDHGKVVYTEKNICNGNCLFDAMEKNCIAATSQWVVKKSALIDVGMFPIVPSKQDSQTMLRLLTAGYEIACVPEVLSRYYMDFSEFIHISNNGRKPLEGELLYYEECKKYYHLFNKEQIKKIEYTFAVMFYEKYRNIDEKTKTIKYKKRMYSLSRGNAVKYFVRMRLRILKQSVVQYLSKLRN